MTFQLDSKIKHLSVDTKVEPLNDTILVDLNVKKKDEGLIITPEDDLHFQDAGIKQGTIVSMGRYAVDPAEKKDPQFEIGDQVLLAHSGGSSADIFIGNRKEGTFRRLRAVTQKDLLCKLSNEVN